VPSCGQCVPCLSGRAALCEPGAAANTAGTLLSGDRRWHGGYHHHLGVNTWAADAPRAGDADARLLEWELRLPAATDVAAASANAATAGFDVRRDNGNYLITDRSGITVRLMKRSDS
jgi:alcohol dehydrogenase